MNASCTVCHRHILPSETHHHLEESDLCKTAGKNGCKAKLCRSSWLYFAYLHEGMMPNSCLPTKNRRTFSASAFWRTRSGLKRQKSVSFGTCVAHITAMTEPPRLSGPGDITRMVTAARQDRQQTINHQVKKTNGS